MNYNKACSEIDYIINNLNDNEKAKIPENVKTFFFRNKDPLYNVEMDLSKSLAEQNLLIETCAFLYIIKYKYFSNEEEKEKLKELLTVKEDFSLNNEKKDETETKSNELIVVKEKKSFFEKILSFFGIKR